MSSLLTRVTQEPFGTIETSNGNESILKFTLTNVHGVSAQVISLGATLTNLFVPDKNQQLDDVLLGFDNLDGK